MTISERTKVPLSVALGFVLAVFPAVGMFATARADVEALKSTVTELKDRTARQDAGSAQLRQDMAVFREQMASQREILQEIRSDLKEVKNRAR